MLQIQAKFQLLKKMQVKIVLIFEKKLKREKWGNKPKTSYITTKIQGFQKNWKTWKKQ